jgi:hypothetical protein
MELSAWPMTAIETTLARDVQPPRELMFVIAHALPPETHGLFKRNALCDESNWSETAAALPPETPWLMPVLITLADFAQVLAGVVCHRLPIPHLLDTRSIPELAEVPLEMVRIPAAGDLMPDVSDPGTEL